MRVKVFERKEGIAYYNTSPATHTISVRSEQKDKDGITVTTNYGPFQVNDIKDYSFGQELELKLYKVLSSGEASNIEAN